MSYSTSNPPVLVLQGGLDNSAPAIWSLSGTDAVADVDDAGYITNGGNLGMKVGDIVMYTDTNLAITSTLNVITVSATAPGAVDLQDGTTIGSTTNTN